MANYKKKKTALIEDKLYNLENWIMLEVRNVKRDNDIKENCLCIYLPQISSVYRKSDGCLTVNWEGIEKYKLWYHLGVEREQLEAMFLKAECED